MSNKLSASFISQYPPFGFPFDWKPIAERGTDREKRLLSTIEAQRLKLVELRAQKTA